MTLRIRSSRARVAVVGAGAFGGWTALELVRRGVDVELIDAWGAGNGRSSSGGETRVIRATYGSHRIYTRMAARSLELWRAHEAQWQRGLLRLTGALWLFEKDDPFRTRSADALRDVGLPLEDLSLSEARRRYPQIAFDDVSKVMLEPQAGYLMARRACGHVAERVAAEGGRLTHAAMPMPCRFTGEPSRIRLMDGRVVEADAFVFACGPWLPQIFPEVIAPHFAVTRQEVYYFGTPAGDPRWEDAQLPVWLEFGRSFIYGIPGNAHRGFKVADDTPGPAMDPTSDARLPTPAGIERARKFLERRFPSLDSAPIIGTEVCQYEATPDANFILDRHPGATNVWIAGGGSGHGFKMGPAMGEMAATCVLGEAEPEASFLLSRFATPPAGGWIKKWS